MNTEQLIVQAIHVALDHRLRHTPNIVAGLHFAHQLTNEPQTLDKLRMKLCDDESVEILDWIIKHRLVTSLTSREVAEQLCPPKIGPKQWSLFIQEARTLPEYALEENLDVDVVENYIMDGYNLKDKCEVKEGDVVLDLGAFNGNSAIVLGRRAGESGKVIAFEPNPSSQEVFLRNIKKTALRNVELVRMGVSSKAGTLRFRQAGAASRIHPQGEVEVEITTVDEYIERNEIDKVDFLKFDIEGFESDALAGCERTIRKFRPKMAISVYHLHYDLFRIPQMVELINPWYKFYMRHNANYDGEIVMYCQPR